MSNNKSSNYKDATVDTPGPTSCITREKSNVIRRAQPSSACRNIVTTSSTTHERGIMKGAVSSSIKKPKIEVVMEPSIEVMDHTGKQDLHGPQRQELEQHVKLQPPSLILRYTCVSILLGICCIWGKYVFINENDIPDGQTVHIHNGLIPFTLTLLYVISLPLLHTLVKRYNIHNKVDVKLMLRESMIVYNAIQVVLNGWMVYRILFALVWKEHPFIAGPIHLVDTGAAYAVYVHYCDKYLEFLDTYFMILRGKMDQVR
jgi:GNS1/SUR4 family